MNIEKEIIGFKIWYSASVVDSTQLAGNTIYEKWTNAPNDDVQEVVFYFADKDGMGRPERRIMKGVDYYAMEEDHTLHQSFDDITQVTGHILLGKYTTWGRLEEIGTASIGDYGEGWLYPAPDAIPDKGD